MPYLPCLPSEALCEKGSAVEGLSAGLEPYKNVDILSPEAPSLVGGVAFLFYTPLFATAKLMRSRVIASKYLSAYKAPKNLQK